MSVQDSYDTRKGHHERHPELLTVVSPRQAAQHIGAVLGNHRVTGVGEQRGLDPGKAGDDGDAPPPQLRF